MAPLGGVPGKWIEHVPAACQGCGSCVAECPQDAIALDAL
ncbi:4Fe-4S binding protein, partial [Vulcanisaeta souniana]